MIYAFDDFEVDTQRFELRHDGAPVAVEPQVYDVLLCLLRGAGRVVTKGELFDDVWEGRVVSEAALTSRLKALRAALDDSGREQRLIRTVRGRGYVFVAPLTVTDDAPAPAPARATPAATVAPPAPAAPLRRAAGIQRGRDAELARLLALYDAARAGEGRQIAFVTGEAGLGKSTLVDAFVAALGARGDACRITLGQCLEHQGRAEAYLPLLEALSRLCRAAGGDAVVDALARHAPSWLLQLPDLHDGVDVAALAAGVRPARPDRMLRELIDALEALAERIPLVLLLEDLHWSDASTIDLVSRLSFRHEPAQLVVIGTLRYAEADADDLHIAPVVRALTLRRGATRVDLAPLGPAHGRALIADHLPGRPLAPAVTELLWRRTGGHPLFTIAVLRAWRDGGLVVEGETHWAPARGLEALDAVPETLGELVAQKLDALPPEAHAVLEAAAVAGVDFASATVAAAAGVDQDRVEDICDLLAAHRSFMREVGLATWPDGTITALYAFEHALVQGALYQRLPAARRARLHRRVAGRLEAGLGPRAARRAAELAFHYQRGQDAVRALCFTVLATEQAVERRAYRDTMNLVARGLSLVPAVARLADADPVDPELRLQLALALAATALDGYAAPAAGAAYLRARELAHRLGEAALSTTISAGLCRHYSTLGDPHAVRAVAEPLAATPGDDRDAMIARMVGHMGLATANVYAGNPAAAIAHGERVVAAHRARAPIARSSLRDSEGLITTLCHLALALTARGRPRAAREAAREAVEIARAFEGSFTLAIALHHRALVQIQSDAPRAELDATIHELEAFSTEHDFAQWRAAASLLRGWFEAHQTPSDAALDQIRGGIAGWARSGARVGLSVYYWLLADAQRATGDLRGALDALDRAEQASREADELLSSAEMARLRGELLALLDRPADADAALASAHARAVATGTPMVALRALEGRARLGIASTKALRDTVDALAPALDGAEEVVRDAARALRQRLG